MGCGYAGGWDRLSMTPSLMRLAISGLAAIAASGELATLAMRDASWAMAVVWGLVPAMVPGGERHPAAASGLCSWVA